MRTATITWISYNNYGTLLQAYALQKKVEQLGHENLIISDREILNEWKKKTVKTQSEYSDAGDRKDGTFERLKRLFLNPSRLSRMILMRVNYEKYEFPYVSSQMACEKFRRNELNILYNKTLDILPALNNEFDLFIAGSDQVWSVFESIFNSYYFLDFVTKKKVSYAPSLGTNILSQKNCKQLKELLSDYINISVREKTSADQLSKLLHRKVEWVADPTFLHDRMFWERFIKEIAQREKKYLLCYFLENKKWYFSYAKQIAKKLHLEIVLLPNKWDYVSSEHVVQTGVGPKEFVSLIRHADYVLTDSYHGSIFSLIFQRDFQYLLRFNNDDPASQNIRIQSLFDFLDLNDRIISADLKNLPAIRIENYRMVTSKIEEMRVKSEKYLQNCFK